MANSCILGSWQGSSIAEKEAKNLLQRIRESNSIEKEVKKQIKDFRALLIKSDIKAGLWKQCEHNYAAALVYEIRNTEIQEELMKYYITRK